MVFSTAPQGIVTSAPVLYYLLLAPDIMVPVPQTHRSIARTTKSTPRIVISCRVFKCHGALFEIRAHPRVNLQLVIEALVAEAVQTRRP